MLEVQRISQRQRDRINTKLKSLGLELKSCSITANKATISINKGSAATFNYRKVANLVKDSFDTILSAIIVDGREFAV